MEKNNEEVVTKVLREMEQAEKNLLAWNVSWTESYENICVPEEWWNMSRSERLEKGEDKYFKIDWYKATTDSFGCPLKVIPINDYYDCSVGVVNWDDIRTHHAVRDITFSNDGTITFSKNPTQKCIAKKSNTMDYQMKFDVSSDDFEVTVYSVGTPTTETKSDYFQIFVKGDTVLKKYNNITIIEDLKTGLKRVSISLKHARKKNDVSVTLDASLTNENQLERAALVVQTHKGNGKVNGTYRFDASKEKGVRASFYSRKGKHVDLTSNSLVLDEVSQLVNAVIKKEMSPEEVRIIESFMKLTNENLVIDSSIGINNLHSFYLDMGAISDVDRKVAMLLKGIKGEIPIVGLKRRIEHYFEKVESTTLRDKLDKTKKLKL